MIYVIFGASGSGKTTLLNCVYKEFGERSIHKKGTTRLSRKYDDIEIESYPMGLPEDRFGGSNGYIYSQYGYDYGIEKRQLDDAIKANVPHFLICNDVEIIRKLRQEYRMNICVVYLSFDAPKEGILAIQKARGITDDEIELRISKIEYLNKQFIENSSLFDGVIINKYGDNPSTLLWQQMKRIMSSFEDLRAVPEKEVIFQTIDYLVDVIKKAEITKATVQSTIEKGFIFIIMPFGENREQKAALWNTYTNIKQAAATVGYRAERVDFILGSNSIDNKIYQNIEKAELIIADLTLERPNCYFEVGYAKALGKNLIFMSKNGTKIHFDVEHYDHITYDTEFEMFNSLQNKLHEYKALHSNNQ